MNKTKLNQFKFVFCVVAGCANFLISGLISISIIVFSNTMGIGKENRYSILLISASSIGLMILFTALFLKSDKKFKVWNAPIFISIICLPTAVAAFEILKHRVDVIFYEYADAYFRIFFIPYFWPCVVFAAMSIIGYFLLPKRLGLMWMENTEQSTSNTGKIKNIRFIFCIVASLVSFCISVVGGYLCHGFLCFASWTVSFILMILLIIIFFVPDDKNLLKKFKLKSLNTPVFVSIICLPVLLVIFNGKQVAYSLMLFFGFTTQESPELRFMEYVLFYLLPHIVIAGVSIAVYFVLPKLLEKREKKTAIQSLIDCKRRLDAGEITPEEYEKMKSELMSKL